MQKTLKIKLGKLKITFLCKFVVAVAGVVVIVTGVGVVFAVAVVVVVVVVVAAARASCETFFVLLVANFEVGM